MSLCYIKADLRPAKSKRPTERGLDNAGTDIRDYVFEIMGG